MSDYRALVETLLDGRLGVDVTVRMGGVPSNARVDDESRERLAAAFSTVAAEARREALEEAAALADRYAQRCERCPYPESCRHSGGRDVASYIRELKDRA